MKRKWITDKIQSFMSNLSKVKSFIAYKPKQPKADPNSINPFDYLEYSLLSKGLYDKQPFPNGNFI